MLSPTNSNIKLKFEVNYMVEVDDAAFKEVANEIRDVINWIKVFEEEYNLPVEVVDKLRSRLEEIAVKLGLEAMQ